MKKDLEFEIYKRLIEQIYEDIENKVDEDSTIDFIVSEFMKLQYLKKGVLRHFIEYIYSGIKCELED